MVVFEFLPVVLDVVESREIGSGEGDGDLAFLHEEQMALPDDKVFFLRTLGVLVTKILASFLSVLSIRISSNATL